MSCCEKYERSLQSARQRGVRGTVRGVRGMRGTQKIKKNLKNILKNIKKILKIYLKILKIYKISKNAVQFGWLVFFKHENTKKRLVWTGFEPTTSPSPAKRLIHLSYKNNYICNGIKLLFICAITRSFPSEPPNVNPDSGTPPRVFYKLVLVLVSF